MGLTDAALLKLDAQREELQERIKRLEAREEKIKDKIIKEFERRGSQKVGHGGVTLTYVQQETVTYRPTLLKLKSIPAAVRARIAKDPAVDAKKLADEVAKGNISPALVARHSDVVPKKPYYTRSKS